MPTYQSILSNPNVASAQNSVNTANSNLNAAQNTYNGLSAGSSTFSDALKQALLNKFNGNQDLVNQQGTAFNQYLNAAANAQNEYSNWGNQMAQGAGKGIINPYAVNDAVQSSINDAYSNYSNAQNLLNQRVGTINDLVNSGGNIYQGQVTNAQNAVNTATEAQKQAQDIYNNAFQQAQADYQNRLNAYNAYTQGQQALGLAKFYGGGGAAAMYGGGAASTAAPDTYQNEWNNYNGYLQAQKLANNNPYNTQNNLYQYLTAGPGAALSSDIKNQFWKQWQQEDAAYKNSPLSQQSLVQTNPNYNSGVPTTVKGAILSPYSYPAFDIVNAYRNAVNNILNAKI